jgi:hypothetical protein
MNILLMVVKGIRTASRAGYVRSSFIADEMCWRVRARAGAAWRSRDRLVGGVAVKKRGRSHVIQVGVELDEPHHVGQLPSIAEAVHPGGAD